jgi:hypothetical protein
MLGTSPKVRGSYISHAYLDESNVGGFFSEALTADVETVLSDETSLVSADSAEGQRLAGSFIFPDPAVASSLSFSRMERTKRELPFRRFGVSSSRRIRET